MSFYWLLHSSEQWYNTYSRGEEGTVSVTYPARSPLQTPSQQYHSNNQHPPNPLPPLPSPLPITLSPTCPPPFPFHALFSHFGLPHVFFVPSPPTFTHWTFFTSYSQTLRDPTTNIFQGYIQGLGSPFMVQTLRRSINKLITTLMGTSTTGTINP